MKEITSELMHLDKRCGESENAGFKYCMV